VPIAKGSFPIRWIAAGIAILALLIGGAVGLALFQFSGSPADETAVAADSGPGDANPDHLGDPEKPQKPCLTWQRLARAWSLSSA
jgi:hypothetical protein